MSDHGVLGKTALDKFTEKKSHVNAVTYTSPNASPSLKVRTNTVLYIKYLHTVRVPDVASFCGG
jgi:hypothetical protein